MSPRALLKQQHRPIDLQRPVVDGQVRYQSVCCCGRRAVVGSRKTTQQDQKAHRREVLILAADPVVSVVVHGPEGPQMWRVPRSTAVRWGKA